MPKMNVQRSKMLAETLMLKLALRLPISLPARTRFQRSLEKRAMFNIEKNLNERFSRAFSKIPEARPLVSVIIVSYNSSRDLSSSIKSVVNQSYPKIELIVVENGTESNERLVKDMLPSAKYYHSKTNLGFAGANNFAMSIAQGEFICLVNPDSRLDSDCIFELVCAFDSENDIAIAVPKLRFWSRFCTIEFSAAKSFYMRESEIIENLDYKKYFLRVGKKDACGRISSEKLKSQQFIVRIDLPVGDKDVCIPIYSQSPISIRRRFRQEKYHVPQGGSCIAAVDLTFDSSADSAWIINNAGSSVGPRGPFDRGFAEYDHGQFDLPANVAAFCGCVALIKRAAVLDRRLFRDEFFAYYEDSELSFWLRERGWVVKYWPRAIAYHKHSNSSSEGSALWKALVARSKAIYDFHTRVISPEALKKTLEITSCEEAVGAEMAETLSKFNIINDDITQGPPGSKKIGVYNEYWNTFGGGEMHAIHVALKFFCEGDEIYLLSSTDFDVEAICRFCSVPRVYFKKIVSEIGPAETSRFDIFINSTFGSNLPSLAKRSIYLTSFPHKKYNADALNGYSILFNSNFTAEWSQKFWGVTNGRTIYPVLSGSSSSAVEIQSIDKKKIILSIGRFCVGGHAKRQDLILKAFLGAANLSGWTLILIGSLDDSKLKDVEYFEGLMEINVPSDRRVKFFPNASTEDLHATLSEASIYVHAVGLNVPEDKPQLHEHFGMSVFEACVFGCFPVVYHVGGPREIVQEIGYGLTFSSEIELAASLSKAALTDTQSLADTIAKRARDIQSRTSAALEDFVEFG